MLFPCPSSLYFCVWRRPLLPKLPKACDASQCCHLWTCLVTANICWWHSNSNLSFTLLHFCCIYCILIKNHILQTKVSNVFYEENKRLLYLYIFPLWSHLCAELECSLLCLVVSPALLSSEAELMISSITITTVSPQHPRSKPLLQSPWHQTPGNSLPAIDVTAVVWRQPALVSL